MCIKFVWQPIIIISEFIMVQKTGADLPGRESASNT